MSTRNPKVVARRVLRSRGAELKVRRWVLDVARGAWTSAGLGTRDRTIARRKLREMGAEVQDLEDEVRLLNKISGKSGTGGKAKS